MNGLRKSIGNGALLFGLLPVIYFILFGFDGFADTDQGFVPALAWRVKLGQVPYLDFIYVRPPLTPVLHSLELWIWPRELQILGMRLDYYLVMWGSVLFGVLTLRRFWDLRTLGVSPWMLGVLGFLYGVHNFPAMPWHTVDGIFFGSLGFWLLTHPRSHWQMVLGLFALGLAGLAKQPFALLLPLGMGMLFFLQPRKMALLVTASAAGLMVGICALGLVLLPDGFFSAMWAQVMGASGLVELFKTGFANYLFPLALYVLPVFALAMWLRRREDLPAIRSLYGWLAWGMLVALAMIPIAHAGLAFWKMTYMPPRFGVYHALWWAGVAFAIHQWRTGERKGAAVLLGLCALSWVSSISWGYAVPALFALPGIVGVLGFAREMRMRYRHESATETPSEPSLPAHFQFISRPAVIALLAFMGFLGLQMFPYRDAPRWELQTGAGEIYTPLSHIRTSEKNLRVLQELAYWDSTLNVPYLVLPAQPAAHYLAGKVPPLGMDWEHDGEIGTARLEALHAQMRQDEVPVLVEKSRTPEAYAAIPNYRSTLLQWVLEHWSVNREGTYFEVYLPN
jgi:hypothetical protein